MEENESPQTGINRRQLLKRSAIVGGALVWATPVVQSLGGTALAATPSPGGTLAPSWTAIVLDCGEAQYLLKFGQDGSMSCGSGTGLMDGSSDSKQDGVCKLEEQLGYSLTSLYTSTPCPTVNATVDAGGLHISLPGSTEGCRIAAWTVHDGAGYGCGSVCFAPKYLGSGYVPTTSLPATFPKPSVTSCPLPCTYVLPTT